MYIFLFIYLSLPVDMFFDSRERGRQGGEGTARGETHISMTEKH